MKKQLLIISIFVVMVSIFASCSANGGSDEISTTAVADVQGTTHYYEVVTDDTETTALKEIETQADGKAVTEKNGKYVTKEHTAKSKVTSTENKNVNTSSNTTKNMEDADNIVDFEPDDTTKPTETTTVEKEIQPATDKDGWITKWY